MFWPYPRGSGICSQIRPHSSDAGGSRATLKTFKLEKHPVVLAKYLDMYEADLTNSRTQLSRAERMETGVEVEP
jgi:hypothetical protein